MKEENEQLRKAMESHFIKMSQPTLNLNDTLMHNWTTGALNYTKVVYILVFKCIIALIYESTLVITPNLNVSYRAML